MTGPKPKLNNGRIQIAYNSDGSSPHECNLDVHISNPSGPAPFLLAEQTGGTVLWTDAVDQFVALMKAFFRSTGTIQNATLSKYVSGVYQPVDTYSIGVAGTSSNTQVPASEATIVFRDAAYNLDKIVLLEGTFGVPFHTAYGLLFPAAQALVDDVLNQAAGHVGTWYQSKSAQPIQSFLFWTHTLNKRLRRVHGYV